MSEVKNEFEYVIPMRWGDMDAFGHVNNTSYLRYFEEARFLWMLEKGLKTTDVDYPVVVTIGCTFLKPLFYPDNLTIKLTLSEPGRSSFMVNYAIHSESQSGQLCAEGYSKVVWVGASDGKSVPLPDAVRSLFD